MKLIGIAGRKQAGKNTVGNFLIGCQLCDFQQIKGFNILEDGSLNVLTEFDGVDDWGVLDLNRRDEEFLLAADETVFPYGKLYSFADKLKEVAVSLFELKPESVYGTDSQKNSQTHLKWEDMPGVITQPLPKKKFKSVEGRLGYYYDVSIDDNYVEYLGTLTIPLIYHKPGHMTGREFLQYFGTEICRKIYGPVWIHATINKILYEKSELAIITDVRFPNEVEAIQKVGGKVIKLTRNIFNDQHASEVALDKENFDWSKFDYVIENENLNIEQTCQLVLQQLRG